MQTLTICHQRKGSDSFYKHKHKSEILKMTEKLRMLNGEKQQTKKLKVDVQMT